MTFEEAYREHYDRVYAGEGKDFTEYFDAYHFARTRKVAPHYQGRSFLEAKEDLRAEYELRYPGQSFPSVEEALRFGYELAGGIDPLDKARILGASKNPSAELDRWQIRKGSKVQSAEEASKTSKSMSAELPQPVSGSVVKNK